MPQKNQKTKKLFSNSIQLEAHQAEIFSGKFSHNGEYFATAGNDKAIHIWETFDKKCKNVNSILHAHSSPILEICWSNDDDRIASCSVDKRVTLWDIYKLQRYWFDYAVEIYTSLIVLLMMIYSIYPKAIPYKIYESFKIITHITELSCILIFD